MTGLYWAVLMFVDLSGGKNAQKEAATAGGGASVELNSGNGRVEFRETDSLLGQAAPMGSRYGAGSHPQDYGSKV